MKKDFLFCFDVLKSKFFTLSTILLMIMILLMVLWLNDSFWV